MRTSMRAKLLGAAVALALFVQPAAAALFTFETMFTATPNVVQVGETTVLHLSIRLLVDPSAAASGGIGTRFVDQLTIYDDDSGVFGGGGAQESFFLYLYNVPGNGFGPNEYSFAVSYDTPGVYSPTFQASGTLSVVNAGSPTSHPGYSIFGSTSVLVTAVPGPIAGAGLPGLVFASGGLLAWWRRTRQRK